MVGIGRHPDVQTIPKQPLELMICWIPSNDDEDDDNDVRVCIV